MWAIIWRGRQYANVHMRGGRNFVHSATVSETVASRLKKTLLDLLACLWISWLEKKQTFSHEQTLTAPAHSCTSVFITPTYDRTYILLLTSPNTDEWAPTAAALSRLPLMSISNKTPVIASIWSSTRERYSVSLCTKDTFLFSFLFFLLPDQSGSLFPFFLGTFKFPPNRSGTKRQARRFLVN